MKLTILFLMCLLIHSICCNGDRQDIRKMSNQRRNRAKSDGLKNSKAYNKNLASKSPRHVTKERPSSHMGKKDNKQYTKKLSGSYGVLGELSMMRSGMLNNNQPMSFAQSLGFNSPYQNPYDQSQFGAYSAMKNQLAGGAGAGFGFNSMMSDPSQMAGYGGMYQNTVPLAAGFGNGYNSNGYNSNGYNGNGYNSNGYNGNSYNGGSGYGAPYSPILGSGRYGKNRRFNLAKYDEDDEDDEEDEEEQEQVKPKRTMKSEYENGNGYGKNKIKRKSKDDGEYKNNEYGEKKYRQKKNKQVVEDEEDDSYTSYKDMKNRRKPSSNSNYRQSMDQDSDRYDNDYSNNRKSNKNYRQTNDMDEDEGPVYEKQNGLRTKNLMFNSDAQQGREDITKLNNVRYIQPGNPPPNSFQPNDNIDELINDPTKIDEFIKKYSDFVN